MAYSGRWRPKNRDKYAGDPTKIVYRSLWERQTFKWCDENPNVREWSSEEVVVPYISMVDRKRHRYFVDLKITYTNGKTVLVEIKPKAQTKMPKKTGRRTQKYIRETKTYGTNISKWEHAHQYAESRGWTFQIWTEDTLKKMGIKILNPKRPRKKARRKTK